MLHGRAEIENNISGRNGEENEIDSGELYRPGASCEATWRKALRLRWEYLAKGIKNGLRLTRNPFFFTGAGNGVRTRDPQLGKLMLYQLSYARAFINTYHEVK